MRTKHQLHGYSDGKALYVHLCAGCDAAMDQDEDGVWICPGCAGAVAIDPRSVDYWSCSECGGDRPSIYHRCQWICAKCGSVQKRRSQECSI